MGLTQGKLRQRQRQGIGQKGRKGEEFLSFREKGDERTQPTERARIVRRLGSLVGCCWLLLGTGNVFCFLHLDFSAFFGWGVLLGSQANIKNKAASSRQSVRRAVAQYQTPKSLSY